MRLRRSYGTVCWIWGWQLTREISRPHGFNGLYRQFTSRALSQEMEWFSMQQMPARTDRNVCSSIDYQHNNHSFENPWHCMLGKEDFNGSCINDEHGSGIFETFCCHKSPHFLLHHLDGRIYERWHRAERSFSSRSYRIHLTLFY